MPDAALTLRRHTTIERGQMPGDDHSGSSADERGSASLEVVVEARDGAEVVFLAGELDLVGAEVLAETAQGLSGHRVAVDLSGLTFLDAAGVSGLLAVRTTVAGGDGHFELRAAQGIVRKVLDLVGLGGLVTE